MGKNWYVVHTYSGSEEKVKQAIDDKADKKNLRDKIAQVLVPTERIIELKGGGKKRAIKNSIRDTFLLRWNWTTSRGILSGRRRE